MKKSILALAALSAFSGAAMAQSSVTVYGIVDVGAAYKNAGAGTLTSLDSGLNSTSRLGFKGTETLSGGLKANFNLEMGLKADTGANDAAIFARGAWVGLSGEDFGSVNLGRHKSLTYIYGAQIDPFMDGLLGKTDLMFKLNTVRDNSITYTSNSFSGFSVAGQYGFGEKTGDATANRVTSVAASYINGPLNANIVWDQMKDTNGNLAVGGEKLLAGVSYDLGKDFFGVKLNAMYEEIKGSTSLTVLKETKEQLYMVGGSIKDGANTFIVSYTDSNVKTSTNANSSRIALGYTYDLSKRTNLYASLARVENEKSVKTLADLNGATARLFNFGIRHKF
ncbi:porin [Undibacterium seohonense]|jgi:predicted porin|uniref:Porin n=1 Tax=Undibacterium seohonense TaxID=1344950 RepID=A0ABR6X8W1_9BURK|nr:porin [Undibacterium seohonense]MBC3809362.1 porin [Undibacterium seohonense]